MVNKFRTDALLSRWFPAVGLILAGSINTLAYAPFNLWWLPFFTFTFLFYSLERASTAKYARTLGLCFGLGWFGAGISWVHVAIADFGGLPIAASLLVMGLLVLYLALYPALFGWAYKKLTQRFIGLPLTLIMPLLWLIVESLRGVLLTGFPWLSIGYSQTDGPLRALAPVVGEFGLQAIVVFVTASLAQLLIKVKQNKLKFNSSIYILPFVSIFIAATILNNASWSGPTHKQVKVAMVQGNIAQSIKWQPENEWPTMQTYLKLSTSFFDDHDLIIWPEAAIPRLEILSKEFLHEVDSIAAQSNTALITGIVDYQPDTTNAYNNIIVLGNKNADDEHGHYRYGHSNRFNKHHLLPIGEFVPLESVLREIAPLFDLPMSSFSRGYYQQDNLIANGLNLSPAICFEIAFADQVRANLYNNSDVILTLSNDAWFGASHGPWQHLQIAQMRALEMAMPVIRVTNNGVTAVINSDGTIAAQLPQFEQAVLSHTVDIALSQTPYKTLGNLIAWLFTLVLAGIAVVVRWRSRALNADKQS